jgi:hypothetical protein
MVVMSVTGTWPPPGRAFTVADLDRMPDDGLICPEISGQRIMG